MIFQAPATADAAGQIEIVNALIAQKPDVIGVSANDGDALAPAGKKAMDAGVKVISWDSAIAPSGRILNENQANSELVGRAQVQMMYDMIGGAGDVAILSAGATMTNQNTWIKWMQEELKDPKYKDINLVATVYGDDDRQKSINEAQGLFKTYPNLKGIISPTSVGIAAAAKALQDAGLCGKVQLTGLGLPSELRDYVKNDCIKAFGLWNPIDQGYLTTYISHRLAAGEIKGVAGETFRAGRMGEYKIVDTGNGDLQVYQGPPFKFDKTNIDSPAASF
jgi:rhamnose transport system substrate-binding protein